REQDVVGIEVARRLERARGRVPLHALAQVEGVDLAVFRNGPLLGEAGHDLGAATLELDDAIVDWLGRVGRGAGGVDRRMKGFRGCLPSRKPVSLPMPPMPTSAPRRKPRQARSIDSWWELRGSLGHCGNLAIRLSGCQ